MSVFIRLLTNVPKCATQICGYHLRRSATTSLPSFQLIVGKCTVVQTVGAHRHYHPHHMQSPNRFQDDRTHTWMKIKLQDCMKHTGIVPGWMLDYFTVNFIKQKGLSPGIACLLLSHLGKRCPSLTAQRKQELIVNILEHVSEKNLKVYNAILQVMTETKTHFSTDSILKEMEAVGLQPDETTFSKMIANQCLENDLDAAYSTINYMKSINMTLSSECFANLALGNCVAGKADVGKTIFDFMLENQLSLNWNDVTTVCCGMAKAGDTDAMMDIIQSYADASKNEIPFVNLVDILVALESSSVVEKINLLSVHTQNLTCADLIYAAHQLDYFMFDGLSEVLQNLYQKCSQNFNNALLFPAKCYLWDVVKKAESVGVIVEAITFLQRHHPDTDLHCIALEQLYLCRSPLSENFLYEFKNAGIEVKSHMSFPLLAGKNPNWSKKFQNRLVANGVVFKASDTVDANYVFPRAVKETSIKDQNMRHPQHLNPIQQTGDLLQKYFHKDLVDAKTCAKSLLELWKDTSQEDAKQKCITKSLMKEVARHPVTLPKYKHFKRLVIELQALDFECDMASVEEFYKMTPPEIDFILDLFWNPGVMFPRLHFESNLQFACMRVVNQMQPSNVQTLRDIDHFNYILKDMQHHLPDEAFNLWLSALETTKFSPSQIGYSLLFWHYVKVGDHVKLRNMVESCQYSLKGNISCIPAEFLECWSPDIEDIVLDCLSHESTHKDAVFVVYSSFVLADKMHEATQVLQRSKFVGPSSTMLSRLVRCLVQRGQLFDRYSCIIDHFKWDNEFSKPEFIRNVIYTLARNGQTEGIIHILEKRLISERPMDSDLCRWLCWHFLSEEVIPPPILLPKPHVRILAAAVYHEKLNLEKIVDLMQVVVDHGDTIPVPVLSNLFVKLPLDNYESFMKRIPKELSWFDPFLQTSVVLSCLRSLLEKNEIGNAVKLALEVLRPVDDDSVAVWSSALELLCDYALKHEDMDVLQSFHEKMEGTPLSGLTKSYQLYSLLSSQKKVNIKLFSNQQCIHHFIHICQTMKDTTCLKKFLHLVSKDVHKKDMIYDVVSSLLYCECDTNLISDFIQKTMTVPDHIKLCKLVYKLPKDFDKLKKVDTAFRAVSPKSGTVVSHQNSHLFTAAMKNCMLSENEVLEYLSMRYFEVPSYLNTPFVIDSFNRIEHALLFGNVSDVHKLYATVKSEVKASSGYRNLRAQSRFSGGTSHI